MALSVWWVYVVAHTVVFNKWCNIKHTIISNLSFNSHWKFLLSLFVSTREDCFPRDPNIILKVTDLIINRWHKWTIKDSNKKKKPWQFKNKNVLILRHLRITTLRFRERDDGEKRRRERKGEGGREMLKQRRREEKGQDRSKNKGRKSTNEYTQVCSVAVTTRRLIA